jgi:hypothetical protein
MARTPKKFPRRRPVRATAEGGNPGIPDDPPQPAESPAGYPKPLKIETRGDVCFCPKCGARLRYIPPKRTGVGWARAAEIFFDAIIGSLVMWRLARGDPFWAVAAFGVVGFMLTGFIFRK